jgi:hypothetical protein
MAPRFKQLLYQTSHAEETASALVGFPVKLSDREELFRGALCDKLQHTTGLKSRRDKQGYFDIDVSVRFFDAQDEDAVERFYSKPWRGFFSWLFRTRYYREHSAEEQRAEKLVRLEVSTSHDYPCVVMSSSIHDEEAIAEMIENIAKALDLTIVRANFPYSLASILTSNKTIECIK